MRRLLPLLIITLWLGLVGCGLLGDESDPNAAATPTVFISPTPALTPSPAGTTSLNSEAVLSTPAPDLLTLRLWTTEEISPRSEVRGGPVLVEQLNAFDSAHPELALDVQLKMVTGQGGVLNYLRTGRTVAPTILPDVVLLQTSQLAAATQEGLIYPLDSLLSREMVNDLYPAAANLSRVNNALMGYPFFLTGLEHLAYNSTAITTTLPITWTGLMSLPNAALVFPAASQAGTRLLLQLYLAAGGTLTNDAGQPNLQVEPLTQALNLINRGRQTGVIMLESDNLTTSTEAWLLFQTGPANVVPTSARNFLDNRSFVLNSQYAPLPGINSPLVPLVEGWVWAITTPDPTRQVLAAELISWLASDATMGEWTMVTAQLPARRSAFAYWTLEVAYQEFLHNQLELAQPFPAAANSTILTALGNAIFVVIDGSKTPEVAAAEAVAAVIGSQ